MRSAYDHFVLWSQARNLISPQPFPVRDTGEARHVYTPKENRITGPVETVPKGGFHCCSHLGHEKRLHDSRPEATGPNGCYDNDERRHSIFEYRVRFVLDRQNAHAVVFERLSLKYVGVRGRNVLLPEPLKQLLKRCWFLPQEEYVAVLQIAENMRYALGVTIESVPQSVHQALASFPSFVKTSEKPDWASVVSEESVRCVISRLPSSILQRLRPYQLQAVEFAVARQGRALLGDETGLGKSLQALAIVALYPEDWPLLVLAPTPMRLVWKEEIMKWLPAKQWRIEIAASSRLALKSSSDIYILSYELAKQIPAVLAAKGFKIVIADEAHWLKSREAKRNMLLTPILAQCKRVVLITGMQLLSHPVDVYNLLTILRPELWPSFPPFGLRYCDPHPGFFGSDWSGSTNQAELELVVKASMYIQRKKEEVAKQLPPIARQRIELDPEIKLVKGMAKTFRKRSPNEMAHLFSQINPWTNATFLKSNLTIADQETKATILATHKLLGYAKMRGIHDFINILIDNAVKAVIVMQHAELLGSIVEYIKKHKAKCIHTVPTMSQAVAQQLAVEFNQDADCRYALVEYGSNLEELHLEAAQALVFAELIWNAEVVTKIEHTVSQRRSNNPLNVYYIYMDSYLDAMCYQRIIAANALSACTNVFTQVPEPPLQTDLVSTNTQENSVNVQSDRASPLSASKATKAHQPDPGTCEAPLLHVTPSSALKSNCVVDKKPAKEDDTGSRADSRLPSPLIPLIYPKILPQAAFPRAEEDRFARVMSHSSDESKSQPFGLNLNLNLTVNLDRREPQRIDMHPAAPTSLSQDRYYLGFRAESRYHALPEREVATQDPANMMNSGHNTHNNEETSEETQSQASARANKSIQQLRTTETQPVTYKITPAAVIHKRLKPTRCKDIKIKEEYKPFHKQAKHRETDLTNTQDNKIIGHV